MLPLDTAATTTTTATPKSKVYAVAKGRTTGIFHTWEDYAASVRLYSSAKSRCFAELKDAQAYLAQHNATATTNAVSATPGTSRFTDSAIIPYETTAADDLAAVSSQSKRRHSMDTGTFRQPPITRNVHNPYSDPGNRRKERLIKERLIRQQQKDLQQRQHTGVHPSLQHHHPPQPPLLSHPQPSQLPQYQPQTLQPQPRYQHPPPPPPQHQHPSQELPLFHQQPSQPHQPPRQHQHPSQELPFCHQQPSQPPQPPPQYHQQLSSQPTLLNHRQALPQPPQHQWQPHQPLPPHNRNATTQHQPHSQPHQYPPQHAPQPQQPGQHVIEINQKVQLLEQNITVSTTTTVTAMKHQFRPFGAGLDPTTMRTVATTSADSLFEELKLDMPAAFSLDSNESSKIVSQSSDDTDSDNDEADGVWAEEENVRLLLNSRLDVFFCTLLRTTVREYAQARTDSVKSFRLWSTLCARAGIQVPNPPRIQATYPKHQHLDHFNARAAFVLEEARHSLSEPLGERWYPAKSKPQERSSTGRLGSVATAADDNASGELSAEHSKTSISVELIEKTARKYRITLLTFAKHPTPGASFARNEVGCLNYCEVVECRLVSTQSRGDKIAASVLGWVTDAQLKPRERPTQVNIAVFCPLPQADDSSLWTLRPVHNCVSLSRQFVALLNYAHRVPFLDALLGNSPAEETPSTKVLEDAPIPDATVAKPGTCPPCNLNLKQQEAMESFLNSAPNSITIIQGPPGTGKSTLLVTTMRKWLEQCRASPEGKAPPPHNPRLLVCAPTNKAVSVLFERFTRAPKSNEDINIAIVGDANRLLGEKPKQSPYYQYYASGWKSLVEEEFDIVQKSLSPTNATACVDCTRERIGDLLQLVSRRLPSMPKEFLHEVEVLLNAMNLAGSTNREEQHELAGKVKLAFGKLDEDAVLADFLKSADVVFCTLCSSGSAVMRMVGEVSTLIVDEAAAATEPDLYIPFHVKPTRMLIVGDPKQLPSVVLSNRAKRGGLDVSLHERLMMRCNAEYNMLNEQYRMHPLICDFPSQQFYSAKLLTAKSVDRSGEDKELLSDGRPFLFLDIDGSEVTANCGSVSNSDEAAAVLQLVQSIGRQQTNDPDKFRIITFYRKQVAIIRKKLDDCGYKNVLVSTVDSSQGCESDIVVVSFVRSKSAGFLTDNRRMNVALTRARYQLVCVGNLKQFANMVSHLNGSVDTIQKLREHALNTNAVVVATNKRKLHA